MPTALNVLIVEDSPEDTQSLVERLRTGGYEPEWERVETADEMEAALARREWDIVVSDYGMPHFSGLAALLLLHRCGSEVPFIIYSGAIGEEAAVMLMRHGAQDFVCKDRPARLVPAIQRELRDAADRRARQQAEAALQVAEAEKKRFFCEVVRAVSRGKLELVEVEAIPLKGLPLLDVSLDGPDEYAAMRRTLHEAAEAAGMSDERVGELVLAAGEAATNAIKHAVDGRVALYEAPDRLIVRVSDRGTGISTEDLPDTIFRPGFSTKISLGMGYTLMLELSDHLWLATDCRGTVLQVEKLLEPTAVQEAPLLAAWDRF